IKTNRRVTQTMKEGDLMKWFYKGRYYRHRKISKKYQGEVFSFKMAVNTKSCLISISKKCVTM
ncbi:hypothetical protein M4D76_26155, partial [Peribacillus frigoritolerans]|uniref:hypothetical protein n=1 Tax=Peribacillus frigoritolerans TaxID=450367 RepID=UPI0021A4C3CB